PHAGALARVRRDLRARGVAPLGPHQLRQGRADAAHASRARRVAGALPREDRGQLREERVTSAEGLALCKDALAKAGEAEAEVFAKVARRGFARFAVGELGQHMEIDEPLVLVRVARGARVAEAASSRLELSPIVDAIRSAAEMARFVPETEGFPGFAGEE